MENKGIELALAYLISHPGEAAHLLEQQPLQDAADFLEGIPHREGASVLSRMMPNYVARLCEHMRTETAAAFLKQMEISQVAAVLRYANPSIRTSVSKLLPERVRLACQVLLGYSPNTVGAWMQPSVPALPADCTAGEALSRIKTDESFHDLSNLYVVGRDGVLLGKLNCRKLLSLPEEAGISAIMDRNLRVVQGRATLETAFHHKGWKSRDALPVVNRKNQFVGVARYVDMRKGIAHGNQPVKVRRNDGIFLQVCEMYGRCLIGLFNTFGSPNRRIKA